MADLYREKVAGLCEALEHDDARTRASEAIRGLLDGIILEVRLSDAGPKKVCAGQTRPLEKRRPPRIGENDK